MLIGGLDGSCEQNRGRWKNLEELAVCAKSMKEQIVLDTDLIFRFFPHRYTQLKLVRIRNLTFTLKERLNGMNVPRVS